MTPNTCWIFGLLLSSVFFRVCNTNSKYRVTYFDGDPLGLTLQPLFVDYSDLVRLVIVNWNRRSVCLCLLLLCGDVNPNPGPTDYPCSVCGLNVLDDVKAVCCDSCDQWVHVSCDPSLSDSLYDEMVQQSSEDVWYCSVCVNNDSQLSNCSTTDCSTKQKGRCLSCICLNA